MVWRPRTGRCREPADTDGPPFRQFRCEPVAGNGVEAAPIQPAKGWTGITPEMRDASWTTGVLSDGFVEAARYVAVHGSRRTAASSSR